MVVVLAILFLLSVAVDLLSVWFAVMEDVPAHRLTRFKLIEDFGLAMAVACWCWGWVREKRLGSP